MLGLNLPLITTTTATATTTTTRHQLENIKPRRHEGSRSREWRRLLLKRLSKTHVMVTQHVLGGMQLAIFVR